MQHGATDGRLGTGALIPAAAALEEHRALRHSHVRPCAPACKRHTEQRTRQLSTYARLQCNLHSLRPEDARATCLPSAPYRIGCLLSRREGYPIGSGYNATTSRPEGR